MDMMYRYFGLGCVLSQRSHRHCPSSISNVFLLHPSDIQAGYATGSGLMYMIEALIEKKSAFSSDMPSCSPLTCAMVLNCSSLPPAVPIVVTCMLAYELKASELPWASHHPLSLCASSMSGLAVIEPELSKLKLRPPKSETLTPL